ncbi:MAG: L-seryl-tRNA(Sec) selenium transferase [Candidatus Eisenbacteria bacterium]|nr:L-seryl-tRNA(Sec) selenium transferase [Candidatus Eisenbacteria bacterium]
MPTPKLRTLPAVEKLLGSAPLAAALASLPRAVVVAAVREELAAARKTLRRAGAVAPDPEALAAAAAARARAAARPQLVRVLNATGIVLHTNLGRAPLAEAARRAVNDVAAGYCSLEFDLEAGRRGDRGLGVERRLLRLTGAEAAAVVNNGAAAVLLALTATASGHGVVVSRGELVEIGGSFRVPEVMERSGARLIEVGSTNRTHLRDYERAFARGGRDIAAILRVHPSNFRIEGFTARPTTAELAALARRHKVPLIEDLGSGALVDFAAYGLGREPTVGECLADGADLVTFSGDKLLGGAQAGLVLGRAKLVAGLKKDPLARALRVDKLALAALEATLALLEDPGRASRSLPVLAMLTETSDNLGERADRLAAELTARVPGLSTRVVTGHGEVGGGSLPGTRLAGPVVELTHPTMPAHELERRARAAEPPVIGTVRAKAFRLDVRTLSDAEVGIAATALGRAFAT